MRTNFVLIDSENVKLEYIEKLKHEHFRVVLFVGANLGKWKEGRVSGTRLTSAAADSQVTFIDSE